MISALCLLAPVAFANSECSEDTDCVLIPTQASSCFPCQADKNNFKAVNLATAHSVMGPKEKCRPKSEAEFKAMREAAFPSGPPECANNVNDAKCNAGKCAPAELNPAELKAKGKKMHAKMKAMMKKPQGS